MEKNWGNKITEVKSPTMSVTPSLNGYLVKTVTLIVNSG